MHKRQQVFARSITGNSFHYHRQQCTYNDTINAFSIRVNIKERIQVMACCIAGYNNEPKEAGKQAGRYVGAGMYVLLTNRYEGYVTISMFS